MASQNPVAEAPNIWAVAQSQFDHAADKLDLEVNAVVQRLAIAVHAKGLPWIRDVVPALGGVALQGRVVCRGQHGHRRRAGLQLRHVDVTDRLVERPAALPLPDRHVVANDVRLRRLQQQAGAHTAHGSGGTLVTGLDGRDTSADRNGDRDPD